jgi:predicted PurR-regulated permease PerM
MSAPSDPKLPRLQFEDALETTLRLGLVLALLLWCIAIVRPFITTILWGVILAIAVAPAHRWMTATLGGRRKLAAVIFVALVFATAFPWPEAEEGTLTYWFTSPIPRWTVSLGRYIAALLVGTVILTVGVFGIGLPLHTRPEADLGQVTRVAAAATLMAYPAYLALFQLVSSVFRKGLAFGVVFIFVENFIALLTGPIVQLTLIHYVRSQLSRAIPPDSLRSAARLVNVAEPASNFAAITAFAGVTVVALGLSLFVVEWIEYRGRTSQPG